jgi:hypothetical protein
LIEKGKSIDSYRREKAFDGDPSTAWVEGKKDSGVGEYLLCIIDMSSMYYEQFSRHENYRIKFTMEIVNGFAKNENLFKKNNRIKKAEITIYDFDIVPFNPDGSLIDEPGYVKGAYMGREPVGDPTIVLREVFDLEDTMNTQRFAFSGRPHYEEVNGANGGVLFCVAEIRILDAFKGTTYDDTCLSELRINAELRR